MNVCVEYTAPDCPFGAVDLVAATPDDAVRQLRALHPTADAWRVVYRTGCPGCGNPLCDAGSAARVCLNPTCARYLAYFVP
jgi:hypothetical protein